MRNDKIWQDFYQNKKGRSLKKTQYAQKFLKKEHAKILELFMANGSNISMLKSKNKNATVYGIDNDKKLCEQARKKGYKTINCDCKNMKLKENSFDFIYCNSFHHCSSSFNQIFNKTIKLLKKNGILVGVEPYGNLARTLHFITSLIPDAIISVMPKKEYIRTLKHEVKQDNVLNWYNTNFKKTIREQKLINYKRDLLGIWYCIRK